MDAAQLQRPGKATRLLAFIVVVVLPLGLSTLDPELGKHARFGGAAASIAAGVASDKAQGQVTTNTATATIMA